MATLSRLAVAFFAIAGTLASPVDLDLVERNVTERGEPDFILGAHNAVRKRQSPNYSQDYIASGANVQFTPNGNSFSVTFNTNQDFVVGRGWSTGDTTYANHRATCCLC